MRRSFIGAAATLILLSTALAQTIAPQQVQWSVNPAFSKDDEARRNISGAACAPAQPPFGACLAVNDQKKYAQFFTLSGNTIVPGAVIRLLENSAATDPDAEGVAYHDGYFYVAGSHGVGRMDARDNSSFVVFRFKVDAKTGKPAFEISDSRVVSAIQRTALLRDAIRKADSVGPYAEKPLNANGVNIEGVALDGSRIYFGFRGPSLDGKAFVLSTDVEALFMPLKPLEPKVHTLALGPNIGIRDLARVESGILVLSGAVNDQDIAPAVFLWKPSTGALKKFGELGGTPPGAKAETILVLEQPPQRTRVLVLHDGPANGAPLEYWLPKE